MLPAKIVYDFSGWTSKIPHSKIKNPPCANSPKFLQYPPFWIYLIFRTFSPIWTIPLFLTSVLICIIPHFWKKNPQSPMSNFPHIFAISPILNLSYFPIIFPDLNYTPISNKSSYLYYSSFLTKIPHHHYTAFLLQFSPFLSIFPIILRLGDFAKKCGGYSTWGILDFEMGDFECSPK